MSQLVFLFLYRKKIDLFITKRLALHTVTQCRLQASEFIDFFLILDLYFVECISVFDRNNSMELLQETASQ